MFQNNPVLGKKFLLINVVSGLMGLFFTLGWRDAFIFDAIFLTKYILIAITCISMVVLFFWILDLLGEHAFPSKKIREKGTIAISTVLLFLAIQYLLIGIIGERFAEYQDQAAIIYCERIGEIAEEYKTLNGEYPTRQAMALLEKPRQPFSIEREYRQSSNGASCSYDYWLAPPGATKTYSIPEKEWAYMWNR